MSEQVCTQSILSQEDFPASRFPWLENRGAAARRRENAADCILCLRCVEECPQRALKF